MRKQATPDGMSTLEAIAGAIAELESPELAEPLLTLYDQLYLRLRPVRTR